MRRRDVHPGKRAWLGLLLLVLTGCSGSSSRGVSDQDGGASLDAGPAIDGASSEAAPDGGCATPSGPVTVDPSSSPGLSPGGDPGSTYGFSDPSLMWPGGGTTGYMSYSAATSSGLFTRIARTTDGRTFTYVVDANADADVAVTTTDTSICGSTTCSGRLVHETSSLVDDAADVTGARYKLFDYSYVIVPAAASPAQHAWGYIGLYTAPDPAGPWSTGTKALGWTSSANGLSATGAATMLSSVTALSDCAAFTEPAVMVDATTGDLFLALGCAAPVGDAIEIRVVLLRSSDHAASFSYVGLLLSAADGTALGSATPGIQPSDFFQDAGTTYLVTSTLGVTPSVADAPAGYTSCTVVPIADLGSATVVRSGGAPVSSLKLVAPGGAFAGACSFKPEFATGYLVDEVSTTAPPNRIFASGVTCP
jgi:hypothetical protein